MKKKGRQINFHILKYSITREFGKLELDHEVLMRIYNGKQDPINKF